MEFDGLYVSCKAANYNTSNDIKSIRCIVIWCHVAYPLLYIECIRSNKVGCFAIVLSAFYTVLTNFRAKQAASSKQARVSQWGAVSEGGQASVAVFVVHFISIRFSLATVLNVCLVMLEIDIFHVLMVSFTWARYIWFRSKFIWAL